MFESNPNIFINAFFVLIIVSLSSFGLVLSRLRNDNYPAVSLRYFFLYFAFGTLVWISLWIKESLFISMSYSAVLVLYVLASMFLLLAVLNDSDKLRLPITIIAIHLIIILASVFVESVFQAALVEGFYTLAVYPVIAVIALKRASINRDIGNGIIGMASILAFVVSPVQLYGALIADNSTQIYAASIILQPISFVLVGIGFLTSMLVSQSKQQTILTLSDPLTGLYTRRGMVHAVEIPLALLRRSEGYIAAITIDIDSFEKINDTYGHGAEDFVLVEVAKIIRTNTRDSDIACHLDDDKFVVLLPGESEYTELVAERLRNAIENATLTYGERDIQCTASLGAASQSAHKVFDYLLNIADKALHRAKSEGGNCVRWDVE